MYRITLSLSLPTLTYHRCVVYNLHKFGNFINKNEMWTNLQYKSNVPLKESGKRKEIPYTETIPYS